MKNRLKQKAKLDKADLKEKLSQLSTAISKNKDITNDKVEAPKPEVKVPESDKEKNTTEKGYIYVRGSEKSFEMSENLKFEL